MIYYRKTLFGRGPKLTAVQLKYLLIPEFQFEIVRDFLKVKFPNLQLLNGRIRDSTPPVHLLILANSEPLVYIEKDGGKISKFEAKGNSIFANIISSRSGSELIFCWVANSDFFVYLNGKSIPWQTDKFGRVSVRLPQTADAVIELRYHPKIPFYFTLFGFFIFILSSALYLKLQAKPRQH